MELSIEREVQIAITKEKFLILKRRAKNTKKI